MTGEPGSSTTVSHDDGLLSIVTGTIVLVNHPANYMQPKINHVK